MNRVSTFGMQNAAIAAMGNQQAKIARTQGQLATGLKLNTAADDPVAAGIAVALDRAAAENVRQGANANLLNNRLTLAEVTLADVGDRVQRLRELTVQANGGIFTQDTRKSLLAEVRGQFDALLAIANMPDGQGRYLFAGSQDATVPFLLNPSSLPGVPAGAASYTTPDILNFNFATIPGPPVDTSANRSFDISGPGGTPMTVLLDTDVTDINGLVAAIQGNPGYAASGVTVAASGAGLVFTATLAGAGAITITGADEFDVGGIAVAGTAPVAATSIVSYVGDQTVREIEVGAGNTIRDVDAGSEIFMRVGAGRVVARAVSGNTGTAKLQSNAFTDPSQFVSGTYRIEFSEPTPGDIQYQVLDSSNAPLVPPVAGAYVPGQAIEFLGAQVTLTGTPAAGDAFTLAPQAGKSIFETTQELITLLEMPDQPASAKADQQNGYYATLDNLQALGDHITDRRAALGGRMALIDKSADQREAQLLATRSTLSGLRDLDYAEAIARLSQETATLDAAQQSYLRMQSLSLFDRL